MPAVLTGFDSQFDIPDGVVNRNVRRFVQIPGGDCDYVAELLLERLNRAGRRYAEFPEGSNKENITM